jgi:hypothetical protein
MGFLFYIRIVECQFPADICITFMDRVINFGRGISYSEFNPSFPFEPEPQAYN